MAKKNTFLDRNWLLPEHIADVLPSQANKIEFFRRSLLDLYRSYGYELVIPPLIEHLDTLLAHSTEDLALSTFQCVDQFSGKTLGIRADITQQVARINDHFNSKMDVARLCYCGSVLHTRPQNLFATREPILIGTELYEHAGVEADLEIIELLVQSFVKLEAKPVRIDLSHSGILDAFLEHYLTPTNNTTATTYTLKKETLVSLLNKKDIPGITQFLKSSEFPEKLQQTLVRLPFCYGHISRETPITSIDTIFDKLDHYIFPKLQSILDILREIATSYIWRQEEAIELSIDFSDFQGYNYHTGLAFSAYLASWPSPVARGGRYDRGTPSVPESEQRFGTGFSIELRTLSSLPEYCSSNNHLSSYPNTKPEKMRILAPKSTDHKFDLIKEISKYRDLGAVVIQELSDRNSFPSTHKSTTLFLEKNREKIDSCEPHPEYAFTHEFIWKNDAWHLSPITS